MADDPIDLQTRHPSYYTATAEPSVVHPGEVTYLTIEGEGSPETEEFQDRVDALFALADTLAEIASEQGEGFQVPTLETIWWSRGEGPLDAAAPQDRRYKHLVRVPENVSGSHLDQARERRIEQGTPKNLAAAVELERIDEGSCLQVLHEGPYETISDAYDALFTGIRERGLRPNGRVHEIYLTDPRRVRPAQARTICRLPVR